MDDFATAQDWCAGNVGRIEPVQPLGGGVFGDIFGHFVDAGGGIDRARRWRRKPRILGELWIPRGAAKTLPFRIRDGTGSDVAIAGLEHEIRTIVGIGRCGFRAHHRVLHHAFRPEIRNHGVEHGDVNVIAPARLLARVERRGYRLCGKDGRGLVADDCADHLRAIGHRLGLDVRKAR